MKNKLLLLCMVWAVAQVTFAQPRVVEKTFQVDPDQQISLNLKFGEQILIRAWDKNEVAFKATININRGKLNEALQLGFDEQDARLNITSEYDKEMLKTGRREDCPENGYSTYSWNGKDGHAMVCSKITYEVYVPEGADLAVESISGNIELVDVTGPVRAKSISGFVDLSWPQGKPATIDMKTISGEAYTDMDGLQISNEKEHIPLVGYKINGTIGGGGARVSLESVSGNIYLRSAQS